MQRALKIKLKSLAAEARIIRTEEQKLLGFTRRFTRLDNREGHEEFIAQHHEEYNQLHRHRTYDVAREARASYLAYGFLRGRVRCEIERDVPPAWVKAAAFRIVRKFGAEPGSAQEKLFNTWVDFDATSLAPGVIRVVPTAERVVIKGVRS